MVKDLYRYILFVLSINLFIAADMYAQAAWQHLGVNEGLAQGFVPALMQDSRGFIWFGTSDGLSRYDGYAFKNFRNEPKDSTSISTGIIVALHECPSGLIWIGFLSGNIDVFDRTTERFIHLNNVRWTPTIIPQLFTIAEDSSGIHWIGKEREILRIEIKRSVQEHLSGNDFHVTSLQQQTEVKQSISPVVTFADLSGQIWVFKDEKLSLLNSVLPKPPVFKPGIGRLTVNPQGILQDENGLLWIILVDTAYSYLYSYNPDDGITSLLFQQEYWKEKTMPLITLTNDGHLLRIVESITKVNIRDVQKRTFVATQMLGNPLRGMCDNSGLIWITTNGYGVYKYNAGVERFGLIPNQQFQLLLKEIIEKIGFPPNKLMEEDIPFRELYAYSVFRDHNGNKWLPCLPTKNDPGGTMSPVLFYDSISGKTIKFKRQQRGETLTSELFPLSSYVKLFEANNGVQWFIGWNALSAFDSSHRTFRHYRIQNGALTENKVWNYDYEFRITSPRKDKDGFFWFGVFQQGLFRFNPVTLEMNQFSHKESDSTSISSNNVIALLEDPSEPDTYFWVGTEGGGLNKFDKATGRCLHYTTMSGLPNNVVYTIFPDKRGRLWISTNNGLCRFEPKSSTFTYYDIHDGLQGMEFNRERNFQAADGKIYLEGTGGMNVFYPEEIVENSHVPKIVFTDFKLHGRSVSILDPDSPLKKSITETQEIVLPYEQNILSVEFAALDYFNTGSNRYSYRLLGYNEEWTKPSTEHSATFTNLSPGSYILQVRGSNNDDVWNKEGISLSLIVLPPWYKTWWAYGVYGILLVAGLLVFRRYDLKRIRLKDQLQLAELRTQQLKEVDQLKMQFFQNISHEFRTPLTLILGPIEKLLNETIPEENKKRDLRLMRRNAQRLLRLINQLLDLSKVEAGSMKLHAVKADVVAFTHGITMAFHSLAERKGIFFDIHSDGGAIDVYFDKEKLEKILINLLSNAFKFTPDHGEILVTIRTDHEPVERTKGESTSGLLGKLSRWEENVRHDYVQITVRDTGIGIPPEKLPHIFDRFYQADSSSTRLQEGTGIGLALVKDLVSLHHGTITVTSEPGKGSSFHVMLPLGCDHLQPEEMAAGENTAEILRHEILSETEEIGNTLSGNEADESQWSEIEPGTSEGKPVLLVMEDNADVQEYIKSYLIAHYSVLSASDGEEGVTQAKETIPDLIISDVMMPKMDGYEVCRRLKQDEKTSHIPIILLTAKAAKEDKIDGLETGADDYLVKPFDSAELLVRVKNLIDTRKKLREKFGKELVTLKPNEVAVNSVDQVFLNKVMEAIEQELSNEELDVNELAHKIGMSAKQLQRKLKGLANVTPADFIRTFRLQRAKAMLLSDDGSTIAEIAYAVGFNSPAYFSKCYNEQFGMTPSAAKKNR